jgi:hypothetical protein
VTGLWTAFADLDASVGIVESERITIEESPDGDIHLDDLAVAQHDGRIMIHEAEALITAGQDAMIELFRSELSHVTLISVGHRVELEDYHDRKLTLHRLATRVEMAAGETIHHNRRLSSLLRRALRPRPSPDPASPIPT